MTGNTTITLRGRIGTDLRKFKTRRDQVIVRFRLAVSQYRIRDDGTFEERDTQWYTVRAWDRLAENALASLHKGDPVIVVGRATVNVWKDDQGEARGELVITAQAIGPDLGLGISRFARTGAFSSARPPEDGETARATGSEEAGTTGSDPGSAGEGAASGGAAVHLEGPDPDLPGRQADWGRDGGDGGDGGDEGGRPGDDSVPGSDDREGRNRAVHTTAMVGTPGPGTVGMSGLGAGPGGVPGVVSRHDSDDREEDPVHV